MRLRRAILSCILAAGASCDGGAKKPNVLLVVVDTLRADRLGCYGNPSGLTPFLDALAARGTVFRRAYANSSWTIPAVASLFTSRYPSQHGAVAHGFTLSDAEVTLAEELHAAGYSSAGYSANPGLSISGGFTQGFLIWSPFREGAAKIRGESLRKLVTRRMYTTCDAAPFPPCFFFLQYMEPHAPYTSPEFLRKLGAEQSAALREATAKLRRLDWDDLSESDVYFLRAAYDAEVAAVDRELETLFEDLARRRFLDDAIVVVTADHGEEFKEHGGMSHGIALYDETVRVPLIVVARRYEAGNEVDVPVSLVDVAPTVLDLLDLPAEPAFEGRSLVPMLKERLPWWRRLPLPTLGRAAEPGARAESAAAEVVLELPISPTGIDRRRHRSGIVRDSLKLLLPPRGGSDVFDLAADPGETAPNPVGLAAQQEELVTALERSLERLRRRAAPLAEPVPLDDATKERLRELGYDGF